jgi:hypothetical protein
MGNRMRFKDYEKELIASTREVEVSYGSGQWIPFHLTHQVITKDSDGYQRVFGTVTSDYNTKGQRSKVISKGWQMYATPGHIRPVGSDWKVT